MHRFLHPEHNSMDVTMEGTERKVKIKNKSSQNGYGNFVSPSHFGSNEAKWLR